MVRGLPPNFLFLEIAQETESAAASRKMASRPVASGYLASLSRPPGEEVELDRGAIVKVAGAWCTRKGIKKGGKEASGSEGGGRRREGGRACRFKVDESYRRKPIGRASISSNSATDPYSLFSHQRQHLSTNSNVSCASTLLARSCVCVCARIHWRNKCTRVCTVWQRACTESRASLYVTLRRSSFRATPARAAPPPRQTPPPINNNVSYIIVYKFS